MKPPTEHQRVARAAVARQGCLSVADAATRLGIPAADLWQRIERGDVRSVLYANRRIVSLAEVERLLDGKRKPGR